MFLRNVVPTFLFLSFLVRGIFASDISLQLYAPSAILIDAKTGSVLYEKDADLKIPPASLTKVMTLYLAYKAIEEGHFKLSSQMDVSSRANFRNQERGSSIMYLETQQKPTLYDLLLGLAIASGNDAAVAVAENLSGSVASFTQQMNAKLSEWGLENTSFVDPSGISSNNVTTARDLSIVAQKYLQDYPQALGQLHSVEGFVYPRRETWAPRGRKWHYNFKNRIPLLSSYEGVDGLKTGYIRESGYNLISTAERGHTRLLGVALGITAPGIQTGDSRRASDMKQLFDYGFENFETIDVSQLILNASPAFHVLGGKQRGVRVSPREAVFVTTKKNHLPVSLKELKRHRWYVCGPIKKGSVIKTIPLNVERLDGSTVQVKLEFVAMETIKATNWVLWLQDYSTYLLKRVLGS